MADDFDRLQRERLRQKINQYLTQQRPRRPPWRETLQWLTDDGNIARNFIDAEGVDIFIELRDKLNAAHIGPTTPPGSPEDQLLHKTQFEDDGAGSRSPQDPSGAGPCMVNPDGLYDIKVVPDERNNWFKSLSANICKGSQSFINKDTIERSREKWPIDPQTNTVTLSWRGYPQWVKIFGENRVHCIAFKIVPSEQMCHVDVAIAEDKSSWNVQRVSSQGATSKTLLPSAMESNDDDQGVVDYTARMIVAVAREVKRPKRSREEDQSDEGASRARRGRRTEAI